MVQSISLDVPELDSRKLTKALYEVNQRINPNWIKSSLRSYGIPDTIRNDYYSIYNMADAYDEGIPTEDLTLVLQPLPEQNGTMLYGLTSGAESAYKMVVKVIVLKEVQRMLQDRGISSNLDMSDVWDSKTLEYLVSFGIMPLEEIEQSKLYGSSKSQQNTTLTIPLAQKYNPDMKIEGVVVDVIDPDISKN